MNYNENQVLELKEYFGFTDREARFLWIVANATGYFLRKHVVDFFNTANGKAIDKFKNKLKRKKLIKEFTFANRVKVYHLNSKRIYTLLGQENSRLRKKHENIYISKRLLILSFIIKNLDKNYLFTEKEKVDFFKNLGIDERELPHRIYISRKEKKETIRFFVDKTPIIFSPSSLSSSLVVHFVYVHSGLNTSLSDFETHLNFYKNLFSKLPNFGLFFITSKGAVLEKAERKFNKFLGEKENKSDKNIPNFVDEVQKYFELKEAREEKNYKVFQGKNASWFFDNETKFKTDFTEKLFREWKENGRKKELIEESLSPKKEIKIDNKKGSFIPFLEGKIDEIFEYSY